MWPFLVLMSLPGGDLVLSVEEWGSWARVAPAAVFPRPLLVDQTVVTRGQDLAIFEFGWMFFSSYLWGFRGEASTLFFRAGLCQAWPTDLASGKAHWKTPSFLKGSLTWRPESFWPSERGPCFWTRDFVVPQISHSGPRTWQPQKAADIWPAPQGQSSMWD
jgi:hypothetical protein